MAALDQDRMAARLDRVEEHVRCENAHDLPGILATFGPEAHYEDEAWEEYYANRDGVRTYYEQLLTALPDLSIETKNRYADAGGVVLEVMIRGTHRGPWRGVPATGRRVEFPLCAVYSFDEQDRLTGERIYYDRATVLRQLGLFHEPVTLTGRLVTTLTHPLTLLNMLVRRILFFFSAGEKRGDGGRS